MFVRTTLASDSHRLAPARRFASPVQAQLAVPAVAGVGRVSPESAQLGAVLDGAEETADAHLIGFQWRLFVGLQESVTGAVGDELEWHGWLRVRGDGALNKRCRGPWAAKRQAGEAR